MADNNMSVSTAIAGKKAVYKGRKLRIAIIGCGGIAQSHTTRTSTTPRSWRGATSSRTAST